MITMAQLLVTLMACLGCGWLGDVVVSRRAHFWTRLVTGTAIGLGAASFVLFLLGAAQLWRAGLLDILSLVACAAGVVRLADLARNSQRIQKPQGSEWFAVALLGLLFGMTLLSAAAPVTDFDGLSYHLAVPKLYLQHGGFYWIPFIHHSNFPFATEMLFAPAVALGAPPCAKVVHWVFFLLGAAATGSVAARLFGQRCALWAALAFALMPVGLWEAGAAYIDLSTAAYTVLSALAVLTALEGQKNRMRWVVASALLAGMAAATKTFSLLWMALVLAWLYWSLRRSARALPLSGVYALVAASVCLPWYTKSFLFTGNPVYPFLYSVFGGKAWGPAGVEMYRATFQKFGVGHSILDFARLPWDFIVRGGAFIDGGIIFGSPGPLFAALLPISVLGWKGRSRALAAALLIYVVAWFVLSQQTRYLLPGLALGCVLLGAALAREDVLGKAARCLCVVAAVVSCVLTGLALQPVLPVFAGEVSPDSYIQSQVSSYWVRDYLPAHAHVLLYREPRGFHLSQTYMWADENLSAVIPYGEFSSAGEMIHWLKQRGWQYAVINRRFGGSGRDLELWDQAIHQGLVRSPGDSAMSQGVEIWQIP
ncbi:MAG: glycosyltransferase family 39 protein [Armatimonadetes bacterium]|nr:glycosyltransferase family 39 protein [Armatimonadota bacterium]